jgi:hypothetical protein
MAIEIFGLKSTYIVDKSSLLNQQLKLIFQERVNLLTSCQGFINSL